MTVARGCVEWGVKSDGDLLNNFRLKADNGMYPLICYGK